MRLVHAAAAAVAALLLASAASAQGLGDAAAREREKRKATPKPAKVYTEDDIGRSMTPVTSQDVPASSAGAPAAQPADASTGQAAGAAPGQSADAAAAPPAGEAGAAAQPAAQADAASDAEKAAEEARAKAEADWRKRLDQARKEEAVYKDVIDKLQLELNDSSGGFYNPGRAAKISFQNENKQKLAEVQGRIATLEEEGRRNNYR
jgi:hypothetical protein